MLVIVRPTTWDRPLTQPSTASFRSPRNRVPNVGFGSAVHQFDRAVRLALNTELAPQLGEIDLHRTVGHLAIEIAENAGAGGLVADGEGALDLPILTDDAARRSGWHVTHLVSLCDFGTAREFAHRPAGKTERRPSMFVPRWACDRALYRPLQAHPAACLEPRHPTFWPPLAARPAPEQSVPRKPKSLLQSSDDSPSSRGTPGGSSRG